jgi:predicted nuclease of predicted toxin-antitoxin system
VKLLLDSMYAPPVAEQLRRRGHDALAARASPRLEDLADRDLLDFAYRDRRVIATENVHDFMVIDAERRREGRPHVGIIMVSANRYPRRRHAGDGRLIAPLDVWLREHPEEATVDSLVWWL